MGTPRDTPRSSLVLCKWYSSRAVETVGARELIAHSRLWRDYATCLRAKNRNARKLRTTRHTSALSVARALHSLF